MNLISKAVLFSALSAASLFGAAAPALAQETLVANGSGAFVANNQELHHLSFSVIVLPNGQVRGHAESIEPSTGALVRMEVTSMMFIGETLAVAGPVTAAVHAPPTFVVGSTAFFAVNDNGPETADEFAGLGSVPEAFGNLTIQQIIAILGPPPPQAFLPLIAGDVRIF